MDASPLTTVLERIHDVVHQVRLVREALRSEKRRLGFFIGAGCPLGVYNKDGTVSTKHIPDVNGLTAAVDTALDREITFKTDWSKLLAACKSAQCPLPNVEHVLTQIRTICALKGTANVDGMTSEKLRMLDARICNVIVGVVGRALPPYTNAYHRFAAWIGQLERVYPIEIFTPNYDLLLEEAMEEYKVPFFDGFVGTREPFFDLAAIEQDVVPARWARLWKLHGSINWISRENGSVYRCYPAKEEQQVMIYPSHLKYDQSRRMPYLAMIDRLKAFFREINPVIITCGYSFADEHLNEVLLDGLRGNRSAHCFALMYAHLKDCEDAARHAEKHANLTVLAYDGAVVSTRRGGYQSVDGAIIDPGAGYALEKPPANANVATAGEACCNLGDFHYLALFLERQFGVKTRDEQS